MSMRVTPDPTRPLPDDFDPVEPTSFQERVRIAAATAKKLLEAGAEIPVSTRDKQEAEDIFTSFTNPNKKNPPTSKVHQVLSTPASVRHLYMMLSEYDHQVVQEAVQLRRYVTNKLIEDTNLPDPRHRLRALELLGKISDVGLFSDKTEVTVKNVSQEELEQQIKAKLFKILSNNVKDVGEGDVIDAEFNENTPEDAQ